MLQTRKIGKENCAVAFYPNEIRIRRSGRVYYGTEKTLAVLIDGQLTIYEDVAKEFGIKICHETTRE